MQAATAGTVLDPVGALVIWLVLVFGGLAGAVWLVRLIVRAVRALEKRSTVAEEVLLLNARVMQQEREIAELRASMQRLQAPRRETTPGA